MFSQVQITELRVFQNVPKRVKPICAPHTDIFILFDQLFCSLNCTDISTSVIANLLLRLKLTFVQWLLNWDICTKVIKNKMQYSMIKIWWKIVFNKSIKLFYIGEDGRYSTVWPSIWINLSNRCFTYIKITYINFTYMYVNLVT